MTQRLFILFFLSSLLSLFSGTAMAQQWYNVELIVFERYSGVGEEQWPVMTHVRQGSLSPKMANQSIQPGTQHLAAEVSRINNAANYRVLYHQAWQQPIRSKGGAKTVQINSADNLIEGTVKLYQVSYLHADMDIWFKENTVNETQWQTASPEGIEISGPRNPNLSEIRRVHSNKLNYFDHPRISAILKLTPVAAPGAAISETPETYSLPETATSNTQQ